MEGSPAAVNLLFTPCFLPVIWPYFFLIPVLRAAKDFAKLKPTC
jgi:hypothetical protein